MIAIGPARSLFASASADGALACTVFGDRKTASANTYDVLQQSVVGTSAVPIVSAALNTSAIISRIDVCNISAAAVTLNIFAIGSGSSNKLRGMSIPAGGSAAYEAGAGWKIFDSAGLEQKLNLKTDSFAVATSPGPFPLTFTPDGRLLIPTLGGVTVPLANISLGVSGLTFLNDAAAAIAAGSFTSGTFSYSY